MENIYEDTDNSEEDEEETLGENELTKSTYKTVIGRMFRGYVVINFALAILTSIFAIDLFAGGGNISIFAPLTAALANPIPNPLDFSAQSLPSAVLNTLSIVAVLLLIGGYWLLRKGKKKAGGINLDGITIADTDEQQQERLMRQKGYINRGRQLIPVSILLGVLIGGLLAFGFPTLADSIGLILA